MKVILDSGATTIQSTTLPVSLDLNKEIFAQNMQLSVNVKHLLAEFSRAELSNDHCCSYHLAIQ